ncbi:POK10 protein, partial [Bucco capensis]|nr:POK10 protein [Bucco capensis]NXH16810.1 POK10 protein [Bucco capensis]
KHFLAAFAYIAKVKTDNGTSYVSSQTKAFFALWGIEHITGIPHSSTGQAIIEHAHHT